MKPVVAVVMAVLLAAPVAADMAAPLSRSVTTTNTVTLAEPMADYIFYVVDQPIGRHAVPISFVPNTPTVIEPHGYRGTILIAVPRSFAERFKTPDEVRNAMRDEQPAGVSSVELPKYLEVFIFGVQVSTPEREVVIRRGPSGVEFDVVKEPRSSVSLGAMLAGLLLTALAIVLGIRWARRRRMRA